MKIVKPIINKAKMEIYEIERYRADVTLMSYSIIVYISYTDVFHGFYDHV